MAVTVTLTCTDSEYFWQVLKDGELFAEHKMVRDRGGAKGVEKYEIFEKKMLDADYGELLEAIEDADPLDVVMALEEINDVDPDRYWHFEEDDEDYDDEDDEDYEDEEG